MARTILIADDERVIRESLCMVLTEEGFECSCVVNGEEAIKKLGDRSFDLLILDYMMPRKDGLEVLKAARKCCPDIQVIVLSSYYEFEKAFRASKLGVSAFLLKPVDFDELVDEVYKLLPNHRQD